MIKNIIIWNCKGSGHKHFMNHVRIIFRGMDPNIFALLVTRFPSYQGNVFLNAIGYDMCEFSEGYYFLGGI